MSEALNPADPDVFAYTHYASFNKKETAAHAGNRILELLGDNCTKMVIESKPLGRWRHTLIVNRWVRHSELDAAHTEFEKIIRRHAGRYDGGESTIIMPSKPSEPLDPAG